MRLARHTTLAPVSIRTADAAENLVGAEIGVGKEVKTILPKAPRIEA